MAKETLTYQPLINASGQSEFRTKSIQFGDGYHQRAPDGIHTDLRAYSLEFKGSVDLIQEIDDFFTRHKGVKSFKWQAPDRKDERLYLCQGIKNTFITGKFRGLSVEIKESLT